MRENVVKKKTYEIILDLFTWLSFFLAVILVVATVFASFSDSKNGKEVFGVKMFIVKTDSMSLSNKSAGEKIYFNAGDVILIKRVEDAYSLSAGDVISFISLNQESYGQTVTHKIREAKYNSVGELIGYVTYGIHTGVNDQTLVQPENVIGVYAGKIPVIGNVFSYLKTPAGYFISILVPCMLLIIFFSIKIGRIIGKREAVGEYDSEFILLKDRVLALERLNLSAPAITEIIEEKTLAEEVSSQPQLETLPIKVAQRYSFAQKLLRLDKDVQNYFGALHNELLSYRKINGRISFKGVSYRFGRKLLAKMTIRGKTLKLHLGLPIDGFDKNIYFQKDLSSVKAYVEVPFTVKVKSNRGANNAIKLVTALMQKENVQKKRNFIAVDAVKELLTFIEKTPDKQVEDTSIPIEAQTNAFKFGEAKKISFAKKLLKSDYAVKEYFNALHNELLSYRKINGRISYKGVSYRFGRKLLAKMTVRGKTLKLHLALSVNEFNVNVYHQKNLSNVKAYSEVPFTVKVKSNRGANNAIKLVTALMQKENVQKKKNVYPINGIKEVRDFEKKK